MKIVSVNVGLPREVTWHGHAVTTGIFKEPVAGRVTLRKLNLDGDRQADLTVHGGEYKAVYCYPLEHYDYWKNTIAGAAVADRYVWRKLYDGRFAGRFHAPRRSIFDGLGGSGGDAAAAAVLQAGHQISARTTW